MLKLRYETDKPAGDQIDCYLSCNVGINKGELKKNKKTSVLNLLSLPIQIFRHLFWIFCSLFMPLFSALSNI